jgi:hypothetical protein
MATHSLRPLCQPARPARMPRSIRSSYLPLAMLLLGAGILPAQTEEGSGFEIEASVPSGPAGGDLQGDYPNPQIDPDAAVISLEGWTGDVQLNEGDGIRVDGGTDGPEISVLRPPIRTWTMTPTDLTHPIPLGTGGLGQFVDTDLLSIGVPAYWFRHAVSGNPMTGGATTLPHIEEIDTPVQFVMSLYWTVTTNGGDVRWLLRYSSRVPGNTIGFDKEVEVATTVSSTGVDRIYRTDIPITNGFLESDQIFAFVLGRLQVSDTNNGNVGLLGIRFEYRNLSRLP